MKSAAALVGTTVAAGDRFILNSAGPKRQELAHAERGLLAYGITRDAGGVGRGVSPK